MLTKELRYLCNFAKSCAVCLANTILKTLSPLHSVRRIDPHYSDMSMAVMGTRSVVTQSLVDQVTAQV
jgi:hypothetical protein